MHELSGLLSVRALRRRPRGQEGSILLLVLAVVLMLSIGVVGMLSMSLNSDTTAVTMRAATKNVHKVDGALEEATNEIRNHPDSCVASVPIAETAYEVECVGGVLPAPDVNSWRTVDLIATPDSGSEVVGRARVRFKDFDSGGQVIGYQVEVCDWLLIQAVSNPIRGCS